MSFTCAAMYLDCYIHCSVLTTKGLFSICHRLASFTHFTLSSPPLCFPFGKTSLSSVSVCLLLFCLICLFKILKVLICFIEKMFHMSHLSLTLLFCSSSVSFMGFFFLLSFVNVGVSRGLA